MSDTTPGYIHWLAAIIEDAGPHAAAAAIEHDPAGLVQFCRDLDAFVDRTRSPDDYVFTVGPLRVFDEDTKTWSGPKGYYVSMACFGPKLEGIIDYRWPAKPRPASCSDCWEDDFDGSAHVEYGIQTVRRLRAAVKTLSDELLRVRTQQTAAAHALDVLRQELGLDLLPHEHPSETRKRISDEIDRLYVASVCDTKVDPFAINPDTA